MLGNVWGWCQDVWGDRSPYGSPVRVDPFGETGVPRAIRGGSWNEHARHVRAASRDGYHPGERNRFLGLRLVRGQAEQAKPG